MRGTLVVVGALLAISSLAGAVGKPAKWEATGHSRKFTYYKRPLAKGGSDIEWRYRHTSRVKKYKLYAPDGHLTMVDKYWWKGWRMYELHSYIPEKRGLKLISVILNHQLNLEMTASNSGYAIYSKFTSENMPKRMGSNREYGFWICKSVFDKPGVTQITWESRKFPNQSAKIIKLYNKKGELYRLTRSWLVPDHKAHGKLTHWHVKEWHHYAVKDGKLVLVGIEKLFLASDLYLGTPLYNIRGAY